MNGRSEKLGERIRDITVRFGSEAMRSLQRYNELLQSLAAGELDQSEALEAYAQFVRDETGRYFRNVADASTGYYDALRELGSIYNPPFFENALSQWRPRHQASPPPRSGVIELSGSPGDEAVSAFRVENKSNNAEEITFAVSELRVRLAPHLSGLRSASSRRVSRWRAPNPSSYPCPSVAGRLLRPESALHRRGECQEARTVRPEIEVAVTTPPDQRPERTILDEQAL